MSVLEGFEPKEALGFFEEICNIPHGSGNLQKISDYLVKFAKDRNLDVIQDSELNVIIKKPASAGYEDREPVILQGHMDMVAVKDADCDINLLTDGLRVQTDGEYVWADGTSLGGDDGIAVAYCLAILDSKTLKHPPIEVVITTNEETGMDGARAIDLSTLKGKRLINIDNEEEGVLLTSCAGGGRFHATLPVNRGIVQGTAYKIEMGGLLGGHSGEMIIKERGNANYLVARVLYELNKEFAMKIVSLNGGVADNAIPRDSEAVVVLASDTDEKKFMEAVATIENDIKGELEIKDPSVFVKTSKVNSGAYNALDAESTSKVVKMIISLPNGKLTMSAAIEGLVETSLNLGVMKMTEDDNEIVLDYAVRSSVESSKMALFDKLQIITEVFGGKYEITGAYPGWKFNPNSELRETMVRVYEEKYGEKPQVVAIHAGVECGLFSEKIDGLDSISIGPDMKDIHTTGEMLSLGSTKRTWEYLVAVLEQL